jgi:uncharacterized small protein (DUF1192 family)
MADITPDTVHRVAELQEAVRAQVAEIERLQADARRWRYVRSELAQTLSPKMDGENSYRFRAMYATGRTVDDAVDKEIDKMKVK